MDGPSYRGNVKEIDVEQHEDSLADILNRIDPPGQEYDDDTMYQELDELMIFLTPDILIDLIDLISEYDSGRVYM